MPELFHHWYLWQFLRNHEWIWYLFSVPNFCNPPTLIVWHNYCRIWFRSGGLNVLLPYCPNECPSDRQNECLRNILNTDWMIVWINYSISFWVSQSPNASGMNFPIVQTPIYENDQMFAWKLVWVSEYMIVHLSACLLVWMSKCLTIWLSTLSTCLLCQC